MHILVVGFNHHFAPVEFREKFHFHNQLSMALRTLRDTKSILECIILQTCNRLELYVVCDQMHTGEYYCKSFIENWFRIPKDEFVDLIYVKNNDEAVHHLLYVVCGLDSLIVGETQILGQVKHSFLKAQEENTTGTVFNMLFKRAVTFGKRVHTETEIGENAVSISYAAVELGKKMFRSFTNKTILLIGAGEMGELTAKHFSSLGTRVLVLNRTFERAQEIATRFNGEARPWSLLIDSLQEADIVVTSTGASSPILTEEQIKPMIELRRSPLFLIDISVPRDIEASVHRLNGVYLYNIDDLKGIVDTNIHLRKREAEKIKSWIEEEKVQFREWLNTLGVIPLISALRERAMKIQQETMIRIDRKFPHLTEQERRLLNKQTKGMINQLLRDPIIRMKEFAGSSNKEELLNACIYLFALEEELIKKRLDENKQKVPYTSILIEELLIRR